MLEFEQAKTDRGSTQGVQRQQAATRRAKAKTDALVEAVYIAAQDAAIMLGPPWCLTSRRKTGARRGEEVALIHATDWQLGKRR